jgi:lipopolysaccharide export system protein LptA
MAFSFLSFILLSFVWCTNLHAQSVTELDSDQPIEISADELEVLQEQSKAIFRGAVEAKQGNITLNSAIMEVFYRQKNSSEGGGNFGAVSRIEVERDVMLSTPQESAKAKRGVYKVDDQLITLTGDVILARGQNMLRGAKLDYNLKTQKSLLSSASAVTQPDGTLKTKPGRVKGVFVPGQ